MSAIVSSFIERSRDTSDPQFTAYIKGRGFEVADVADFKLGFYKWAYPDYKKLNLPKVFDKSILLPCYDDLFSPIGFELRTTVGKSHFKEHDEAGRYHFFGMTERALDAIYSTETVFLTEGTFDDIALSLWKPNILSLMSNKISDGHLLFLKRYVKKVYCCFDQDKWGMIRQTSTVRQSRMEKDLFGPGIQVAKFEYIKASDTFKNAAGEIKRAKDANDLLVGLGKDKFIKTISRRFDDTFSF